LDCTSTLSTSASPPVNPTIPYVSGGTTTNVALSNAFF